MQFYKTKSPDINNSTRESLEIIDEITSDEINNVCFECGTMDPEFISINNAVFLCSNCVQGHYQFPKDITNIIQNDFNTLSTTELKYLLIGGNKNLIEFINFEYPQLKHCPPSLLYKTRALEYYRKRLSYLVEGGIKPLKPSVAQAYQIINLNNNDKDYYDIYRYSPYKNSKIKKNVNK